MSTLILSGTLVVLALYTTYLHFMLKTADETIDNLFCIIQGVADGSVKVKSVETLDDE